jgi:hypothetical protein
MREFAKATSTGGQPTDVTNRDLSRPTDREREVLVHIGHGLAPRTPGPHHPFGGSAPNT